MKQVQTRYFYSALLSSLFFIICYLILKMNIFICILLTILLYIGGIFLFKTKDIRKLDAQSINLYYFLASKVKNKANGIDDKEILEYVDSIAEYTDKILVSLTQRPKKVEQAFDFFDYYLDVAYKILDKYHVIVGKKNKTDKDIEFLEQTKVYFKNIAESFEKQFKNMKEAKILDIDTEIKIFEESISKTDIKVGDNNEE